MVITTNDLNMANNLEAIMDKEIGHIVVCFDNNLGKENSLDKEAYPTKEHLDDEDMHPSLDSTSLRLNWRRPHLSQHLSEISSKNSL